jgi:hypothetical protein
MSYKSIYAYAWDIAETGVEAAVGQFRDLGLDTVSLAGSYHAGKFMRPHGKAGKVYFPEDGTVYFNPNPSLYGAIKPIANTMLAERDVLGELAARGDIATNAWLVLLHNSPLGLKHPDACVENAFGDHYVYSLCPSHPEVRAYAIGLARDVSQHYPVSGLSLESPGYAPFVHGYHHEFALVRQNRWLDNLLGLCFSEHSIAGAEAAGVDARRLRAQVAADIEAYLKSDIDFPDDMAEAFWLADVQADGDLRRYLDWRNGVVTSLVTEIRAAVRPEVTLAVIPSVARPTSGAWYEGADLKALAEAGIAIDACFYEPTAMRVKSDLFDIKRRIGPAGKLRAILRPGHPDLADKAEFLAAVAALRAGGVEDMAFYNWGHLRQHNLAWIGEALKETA